MPELDVSWRGAEKLRSLLVPLGALTVDPQNAREHGARSIESIVESLRRFGQRKPIVVRASGVVAAGSGTLEAARKLGWSHLATVDADGLTEEEVKAYAIADNRTAELSEWNYERLSIDLKGMSPDLLPSVGFLDHELQPLLRATWEPPPIGDVDLPSGVQSHSVAFGPEQWALLEQARAAIDGPTAKEPSSMSTVVVRAVAAFLGVKPPAPPEPEEVRIEGLPPAEADDGLRAATTADLEIIYPHRGRIEKELGNAFLRKVVLAKQIADGGMLVHPETGAFITTTARKKDTTTVVHEVWVPAWARGKGIGAALIARVKTMGRPIELKCPVDLPSNDFYRLQGAELVRVDESSTGKKLNVWRLS